MIPCVTGMDISPQQRRNVVALACKLAWADGLVTTEERSFVLQLVGRLGGANVSPTELDEWLTRGGPEADIADLPPSLGRMFVYEAMRLMEVDGEIADEEIQMVDSMVTELFATHGGERTTLAKIALKRRNPSPQ